MNVILRVYWGSRLVEKELTETKSLTLGSGRTDTLCMTDCGLEKKHISFSRDGGSWKWNAVKPVRCRGSQALSGTMEAGEVLVIDPARQVAVTVIEQDHDDSHTVDLSETSKVRIGRSQECDVVIGSPQVSGKHLLLRREGASWVACDQKSANGTYLNGTAIREKTLSSGDVLDMGPCRVIFTGGALNVIFRGSVKNNLTGKQVSRTARSKDEEYPWLFHRSPRLLEDIPQETVEIHNAPSIGSRPSIRWGSVIVPPLVSLGVMGAVAIAMGGNPQSLLYSAPMSLVGIIMSIINYRSQCKDYEKKEQEQQKKYREYLARQAQTLEHLNREQLRILNSSHPDTRECLSIARQLARRLWERRPEDADFMQLRVGQGEIASCATIETPRADPFGEKDAQAAQSEELINRYRSLEKAPITCSLGTVPTCGVIGERRACINVARNMIVQAATHHSYDELRIVLLCSKEELPQWSFMKWLPHVFSDDRNQRYIADNPAAAKRLLTGLQETLSHRAGEQEEQYGRAVPHYLFICADKSALHMHPINRFLTSNDPRIGVSALFLYNDLHALPKECMQVLEMKGSKGVSYLIGNAAQRTAFTADTLTCEQCDGFARALAPVRVESDDARGSLPTTVSFLQGYGVKQPRELAQPDHWASACPERSMAVPIGVRANGEPFYFDIHEKQYGPHGLVAGMTGSGKSEMVQSWILSMALAFPPEAVSFVLIDFKGTGLLLPFRSLPHLAGSISNLDTNISRNLLALENELVRRQALLDQAGVSNISAYLKLYRQGKVSEPMSYLFLVIDEFAEFKLQFPDFMQVVNRVFAIGRTLGVHILLLTQKPGSVVDDKMNANTRFRWCLKVASSADSREMLQHTDAARITNPGRAYVQVGEDELYEQIQTYWSGAPYDPLGVNAARCARKLAVVDLYGNRRTFEPERTTGFRAEKNEIDAIVEYLDSYTRTHQIPRAKNVWTSKLSDTVDLSQLLHVAFDGERWGSTQGFAPAVGMLDDPSSQSQYPLRLNLPEEGHTVIYGAPGAGKTTFLHTFIMSSALSYSPEDVQIYLLDFGGGSLNLFRDLPHVGGVACDHEQERIFKTCKLLTEELERRKAEFSARGLVSIDAYREDSGKKLPYILAVVDNFGPMLNLYPDLSDFFQQLTREGGSYGMYLVATANAETAVTYRIAQNLKGGIALRMPDKHDYQSIVGSTGGLEPENLPGRGLVPGKPPKEFQTALPAAGENETKRVAQLRTLCARMDEKWQGIRPRKIPVMPQHIRAEDYTTAGLLAGLDVQTVEPVELDILQRQFLLISGLGGAEGKTVLQALTQQLDRYISKAGIAIYEPGQRILTEQQENAGAYFTDGDSFDRYVASLMPVLQERKEAADRGDDSFLAGQKPICIVISDLKRCFDAVSNDTVRRLANIVNLGKGLGVQLVVLAVAGDREELYHSGDMFTINLTGKADVILTEGCFRDHGTFASQLDYVQANEALNPGEAWLLRSGVACRIRYTEG